MGFRVSKIVVNKAPVMRSLSKWQYKAFRKFGAFVRNAARWSMRPAPKKDNKTSAPGEPPYTRTGGVRKNIFYAVDYNARSVVIGPVRKSGGVGAPEALEYGGYSLIYNPDRKKRIRTSIEARPYMRPAFEKGLERLDEIMLSVK